MNDRELNLAMAKVCRILVQRYEEQIEQYPCITVAGKHVLLWKRAKEDAVNWNPVHDWNQVHKFVIPALEAADCEWTMSHHPAPGHRPKIEIRALIESPSRGKCTDVTAVRECKNLAEFKEFGSRLFCEAALEAWQQLEKS